MKYNTNDYINLNIHMSEVELILKSLELYNFNLNNVWIRNIDKKSMELRNDIIYYLYHRILNLYTRNYEADFRIKISKKYNYDIM